MRTFFPFVNAVYYGNRNTGITIPPDFRVNLQIEWQKVRGSEVVYILADLPLQAIGLNLIYRKTENTVQLS